jgi:hypothetical protein
VPGDADFYGPTGANYFSIRYTGNVKIKMTNSKSLPAGRQEILNHKFKGDPSAQAGLMMTEFGFIGFELDLAFDI